jgi:16S rRNA (guanine966-N2)-methyltransferase
MRIISGFLKGKRINYLKNFTTRPLKDSVKENIFNIIKHSSLVERKIEKSNVLDLYSGIGSFGIECISRGAEKVTFVEKDNLAFNTLKKNLIKLSIIKKSNLINQKIENALNNHINEKYHIFFFDPPFTDENFIENLKIIKQKRLFEINHIIIIHREKKKIDEFNDVVKIINIKEYGRSKIIFGLFC